MQTPAERCKQHRLRILEMSRSVPALHIAPAFSCVEIVDALYYSVMREQDVFIMSKGHGCVAQYVVLAARGVLSDDDLRNYCTPKGFLGAHPDCTTPGVHASTGSLGHGLALATGQAYAEKIKGSGVRVYCLVSDGELQEGSSWEAAMMAANLQLSNLFVLVDNNDFGGLARMSEDHKAFYPLCAKFRAFGWDSWEIGGHDWEAITSLARYKQHGGDIPFFVRPTAVVCETIKGRGVSYMEDAPIWHYRSPSPEEYERAVLELSASTLPSMNRQ